ncbi:MAG: glycosyltransferase family 4 protein [Myxococcota bacterium]
MRPLAVVFGSEPGIGGLGHQAASSLEAAMATGATHAIGPGAGGAFAGRHAGLEWTAVDGDARRPLEGRAEATLRRVASGPPQLRRDRRLGERARDVVAAAAPSALYGFTQVSLEALELARAEGWPTMLDNPNTHLRDFATSYRSEAWRWMGVPYLGHPTDAMLQRVEREYALADRIRVSSTRARRSMSRYGVPAAKIDVVPQPIDLERFRLPAFPRRREGPLRLVFVGSLDLRKGFVYLLRAMRLLGAGATRLRIVGMTGDPLSRRLFDREREGLEVVVEPGDPVPALAEGEVLVLPSLEDGFGFVVGEALACGMPVVVTDACGGADWVEADEAAGRVVPPGDAEAIASALAELADGRARLDDAAPVARRVAEAQVARSLAAMPELVAAHLRAG